MIQDQLVDYISAQKKAGVSRDTIKNTLVSAGWQVADVEDTLKKVEGGAVSQPITAKPIATTASSSAPQTMKMSDLVSSSDPGNTSSVATKSFTGAQPATTKTTTTTSTTATSFSAKQFPEKSSSSHGALITEIVLGILVIAIGGLAGYLYFQNNALNAKIASANTTSGSAEQQLAALQQAATASTTALTAGNNTLTAQNKELITELSFYTPATNTAPGATSTVSLSGTLSGGGKIPYIIKATYGAKVYISNSKDANVIAALAPFATSTAAINFDGTYVPGADSMTVTAVNGTAVK